MPHQSTFWPSFTYKSNGNRLPIAETPKPRSPASAINGIRHSASSSTASRVTISQSFFREEPTVIHTAPNLRGLLERDGFSEKQVTFIIVEGQQSWPGQEISRKIREGKLPERLFATEDVLKPIALPQLCDGGLYFELDIPFKDVSSGPTRLKGYIYVRHRNIDRLHNTHSYYSRAASSAATPTTTITSPRITLVIVIPRSPPAVQKASHDSSIPALMKRYYRSSNQLFSDRLCRNPVWILLDLLSLMGNSAGEAWMSNIENILDWHLLFPARETPAPRMPMIPFNGSERKSDYLSHPLSLATKSTLIHRYIDNLLTSTTLLSSQKFILERVLAIHSYLELSPSAISPSGSHRRRSSYSIDGDGPGSSNIPQSSPLRSGGVSSTQYTILTLPQSSSIQRQANTSLQHLAHNLAYLSLLQQQAQNLANCVTASNNIQQRGSVATLTALGVVLGPICLVALVFSMVGFGGGNSGGIGDGRGAQGWVYPLIGVLVVGIVGLLVGIVRRIGT